MDNVVTGDAERFEASLPDDEAFEPMMQDPAIREMAETIVELQKKINGLAEQFEGRCFEAASVQEAIRRQWVAATDDLRSRVKDSDSDISDAVDSFLAVAREINDLFARGAGIFSSVGKLYASMEELRALRTEVALSMEGEVESRGMGTVWVV